MKLAIPGLRKRPMRQLPLPEPDSIEWKGVRIDFTVVRSPRRKRTLGLRVLGGQVEVRAPMPTSQGSIRTFVQSKGRWVLDKLVEHRERPRIPPFGFGDTVPYLGRDVDIRGEAGPVNAIEVSLHDNDCNVYMDVPGAVFLDRWHFHVTAPAGMVETLPRERIREALAAWYRGRAEEVLKEAVDGWRRFVAPRAKPEVRISNARSQWGSCSAGGVLRFSWRCMMLKDYEIEYIVVHELAHLKVRNHSKAFWRVVTKAMPEAADVRRGISQRARTLPG